MSSADEIVDGVIPPQAWGGRYFLDNNDGGKTTRQSVLVFSPQYKEPRFFYLQLRFALDQGILGGGQAGQPVLPFSEKIVNAGSAIGKVAVTMTRALTGQSASMDDSYIISGAGNDPTQPYWLPISVVAAKKIVVNVKNIGDLGLWVDFTIAPLKTLTQEQLLALRWSTSSQPEGGAPASTVNSFPNTFGFGRVAGTLGNGPTRSNASAAVVQLLPADASRRQFWISNESPERLAVRFGPNDPVVTPGSESWDVILDAKGGANSRYQSPLDTFWGEVRGVWEGAPPTGFALASSAIYLLE